MELNCLPLYASANSVASAASRNFMTTIDRLGALSLRGAQSAKGSSITRRLMHTPYYAQLRDAFGGRRDKGEKV